MKVQLELRMPLGWIFQSTGPERQLANGLPDLSKRVLHEIDCWPPCFFSLIPDHCVVCIGQQGMRMSLAEAEYLNTFGRGSCKLYNSPCKAQKCHRAFMDFFGWKVTLLHWRGTSLVGKKVLKIGWEAELVCGGSICGVQVGILDVPSAGISPSVTAPQLQTGHEVKGQLRK